MPNKKYTPEEIIRLLRLVGIETGQGKTTAQAVKSPGFTKQSCYRWRKEYGGLQMSQARPTHTPFVMPTMETVQ